ncbi:MAG: YncE family protein, partial [Planctomycetota bacterium]
MRFPTVTVPHVLLALVAATLLAPGVFSWSLAEEPVRRTPGPQADGSVVLPTQWSLRPIGKQVEVGDFPVNIAIHPDGRHAVILHCGFGPHELAVIDLETRKVLSRTRIDEAFQGLAFDGTGNRLWVSGGAAETLLPFRFEAGALVPLEAVPLRDEKLRGIPAGIAVSSTATTLYAANVWGHSVSRVRLAAADGVPVIDELPLSAEAPAPA